MDFKNVVVTTDGEPDDYFACLYLHLLFVSGHIQSLKFIVTAWTDPLKKALIFKGIMDNYGNYPVYYGETTTKNMT